MILTECEPMYETVFYEDLKAGDNFMFYTGTPIQKNYYTKTDIVATPWKQTDKPMFWAINIVTGEHKKFMRNDFVIPVDIELKIKRPKTAEQACDGCEYLKIQSFDGKPCRYCKRYYGDKWKEEEE